MMSQIQLHVPPSAELAERRHWPLIVPVLFTLSALLVIYYVVTDIVFGVKYFYQWSPLTTDVPHTLFVWSWNLAVPLAALLAGVGAASAVRIPRGRLWFMIGVLVVAIVAPLIASFFVPWGGSWPPFAFGVGGVLIITSVLLTCWFWAQEHGRPLSAPQRGADLRLIAYVLFGFAAFWTCGLASSVVMFNGQLPNLGMVQMTIICIMTDLVVGWVFLLAGHIVASRAVGSSEAELT
jgi:hypothetical protein